MERDQVAQRIRIEALTVVVLTLTGGAFGAGAVAVAVAVLVVEGDPFGEGVAMDSEYGGGVRDMMVVLVERFFDVELFEFREGLVEENSTFQHFVDQRFQSGTHQGFPG
jgi:hypothetical protein